MEDFSTVNLTRRNFVKGALATAGAVALASAAPAVKPLEAFAATDLADGTYKVNANLYIDKSIVWIHKTAYFTNPTDPNENGDMPETPNTELNATLEVEDGVAYVTVPLVNDCFMLISASDGTKVFIEDYSTVVSKYADKSGNSLTRISEITFRLANTTDGSYTLGSCKEYGAYKNPPAPMNLIVPGYLTWTATLSVDFSTATVA